MEVSSWLDVAYVASALCFILCIFGLNEQATARAGNAAGVVGMTLAVVCTYLWFNLDEHQGTTTADGQAWWILAAAVLPGVVLGVVLGAAVKMTQMPQMVGLLNSFGGLAACLAAVSLFLSDNVEQGLSEGESRLQMVFLCLSVIIGAVTFTGSLVACAKLDDLFKNTRVPAWLHLTFPLLIAAVGLVTGLASYYRPAVGRDSALLQNFLDASDDAALILCMILVGLSGLYGIILVLPIGGADMPVVISVLNSLSGASGATSGFMLRNNLLITGGALVASSGAILSYVMCVAMNRSLLHVLKGGFGTAAPPTPSDADVGDAEVGGSAGVVQAASAETEDVASALQAAETVAIVPGYGMAVSHAQFSVASIVQLLTAQGKTVRFGVHPVAGRMPGHMNVLLAEASVPYDMVLEMSEINPGLVDTDVVLVIGANDTVNPDAEQDPHSPIAGMPVIHAWHAKQVFVLKRSMARGYAAVENPLFFHPHTKMYFGDAKTNIDNLLSTLRDWAREDVHKDAHGGHHIVLPPMSPALPMSTQAAASSSEGSSPSAGMNVKDMELSQVDQELEMEIEPPVPCPPVPSAFFKTLGAVREEGDDARVPVTPSSVRKLAQLGYRVLLQRGLGGQQEVSSYTDEAYTHAGAVLVPTPRDVWSEADVMVAVNRPSLKLANAGQLVVSYVYPTGTGAEVMAGKTDGASWLIREANRRKVTLLAMDRVPRVTAAQKLDSLTTAGKITGHRAVIEAMYLLQRFAVGEITASGKFPPAKLLVIGAGVAGLAATATARGLGCDVRCFDTREECEEQVQSLGARFLTLRHQEQTHGSGGYAKQMSAAFLAREMALFEAQAEEVDMIITTALIPGKRAPTLVTEGCVRRMRPGSVIVDTAAPFGGNCELTQVGKIIVRHGVHIVGVTDLTSRMAFQFSEMYAQNIVNLMAHQGMGEHAATFKLDVDDAVLRPMLVTHNGAELPPPPPPPPPPTPTPQQPPSSSSVSPRTPKSPIVEEALVGGKKKMRRATPFVPQGDSGGGGGKRSANRSREPLYFWKVGTAAAVAFALVAALFPASFAMQLMVAMLSVCVGYKAVWGVIPALHTPLMSVSNAISGVVILGGMLEVTGGVHAASLLIGAVAAGVAAINCGGGFYVTHRMLQMFVIKDEMRSLSPKPANPNDDQHTNELHRKQRLHRTHAT